MKSEEDKINIHIVLQPVTAARVDNRMAVGALSSILMHIPEYIAVDHRHQKSEGTSTVSITAKLRRACADIVAQAAGNQALADKVPHGPHEAEAKPRSSGRGTSNFDDVNTKAGEEKHGEAEAESVGEDKPRQGAAKQAGKERNTASMETQKSTDKICQSIGTQDNVNKLNGGTGNAGVEPGDLEEEEKKTEYEKAADMSDDSVGDDGEEDTEESNEEGQHDADTLLRELQAEADALAAKMAVQHREVYQHIPQEQRDAIRDTMMAYGHNCVEMSRVMEQLTALEAG